MLAVVLTLGAMPMYGTFASAGTDEPTAETASETPAPSVEPDTSEPAAAPAPQGEPEATPTPSAEVTPNQEPGASPTPGETPTESPEPSESAPATYENSISGTLWLDMFDDVGNSIYAGDGTRQAEEEPLAGYTVELFKSDDKSNAVATTTTNSSGKFKFENIEPGSYVVGVKTTTMDGVEYLLPLFWLDGTTGDNRFVATLNETADAYLYAYTAPITVAEDSAITGMDAGMRTVPGIQPLITYQQNISAYIQLVDPAGNPLVGVPWTLREASDFIIGNPFIMTWGHENLVTVTNIVQSGITDANGCMNISLFSFAANTTNNCGMVIEITPTHGVAAIQPSMLLGVNAGLPAGVMSTRYIYSTTSVGLPLVLNSGATSTASTRSFGTPGAPLVVTLHGFTVTFDPQGGSVSPTSETYWTTDTFSTMPTPTRSGYTFLGWNTTANGSGTMVSTTDLVEDIFDIYTGNTGTLYAQWARKVDVTYDTQGGSPVTSPVEYASTATFGTQPTPTRSGYTFNGWYTAMSGGTQATSSMVVGNLFSGATGTLYAQWTENTNYVAFDAQNGTPTPSTITRTATTALGTLPTVTRAGYTFVGWFTAASSGTQASSTSTPIGLNSSLAANATLTLYAQWTVNNNTVTFDTQGGSAAPADLNITAVTALGTLATPTRTGYDFAGWWTTPSTGGTQANAASTPIGLDSTLAAGATLTLYARWTLSAFIITEKYVDVSGNPILDASSTPIPDTTQSITLGNAYNGSAAAITGYVCIGYKIGSSTDTFATATAGTSGNTAPTISSVAAEHMVWYIYAEEIGSIKIEKYANDGTTLLPGAEFKLEKLTGPGGSVTSIVGSMTTGAGGSVTFANLPAGVYQVTETKAPAGYDLLTAAFEVDIPKDITYAVGTPPADNSYLYSTTSGSNITYHYYDVTYKVSDQASIAMPSAGATNTLPPYALWGGSIILLAALSGGILWAKRRRAYAPKHG